MSPGLRRVRCTAAAAACVLAAGVLSAPAQADPPSTGSFTTIDSSETFQLTAGEGAGSSASIVTGGTITFVNNASNKEHDVSFAAAPSGVACVQTVGGVSASSTRFPQTPADGTWAGTCTFSLAGSYAFLCTVHDGMTGLVSVVNPTPPPPPPPPPGSPPPLPVSPPPPPSPLPPPPPAAAPVAKKLSLAVGGRRRGRACAA